MAIRFSAAARADLAEAAKLKVDAGAGAGKIRVYSGSQPATADTAVSGTLLLEFPLSDPGFTRSGAVLTLDDTPTITDDGIADGTAGYARVLDSDNNPVFDGSVTASGGGGDFIISDITVETGQTYNLTGTLTWAAS